MTTEDPRMPDYYGTGRQPKSGRSYVGLAIGLVIALLAVSAVPFVIPHLQKKQTEPERMTQPERRGLTLQPEDCQQEQTAVCGMLICELDESQQRYWNLPNGVLVGGIEEGGTAAHAGILPGDVIVRIGEETPDSAAECRALLDACADGETVQIELYRCGEEIKTALTGQEK